jgi:hypothetical protein
MFADPESLVVNTTTLSLPAISRGPDSSVYSYFDSSAQVTYNFTLQHTYASRNRFVCRLDVQAVVTDPLIPANSVPASASVYLTVNAPTGKVITDANLTFYLKAIAAWLTTSTNGARLIAGET